MRKPTQKQSWKAERIASVLQDWKLREDKNYPEVRDLIGVLQREKAEIGVYISFAEPTKPMQKEAAEAGFYTSADGRVPHPSRRVPHPSRGSLRDGWDTTLPKAGVQPQAQRLTCLPQRHQKPHRSRNHRLKQP
jgi:hypothetical protein